MGRDFLRNWRSRHQDRAAGRTQEQKPECVDAVQFARERLGFTPDARQTEVLLAKTKRGLLNCTRQWGKSTVTAAKAVHRLWTVPKSLVLVVSPSEPQSAEFVRKAAGFVSHLGVQPRGDGDRDSSLLLPNGSRLVGLPGKQHQMVRGYSSVNLVVIDEAAWVPEQMYSAVTPMLAVSGGDLWMMSTPAGRRGFFWEEWSRGGKLWTRVSVPATECPRIPKEFLEEERRRMGELAFRQEYMCEFGDNERSVFSEDSIMGALDWDIEPLKVPPFEPRKRR